MFRRFLVSLGLWCLVVVSHAQLPAGQWVELVPYAPSGYTDDSSFTTHYPYTFRLEGLDQPFGRAYCNAVYSGRLPVLLGTDTVTLASRAMVKARIGPWRTLARSRKPWVPETPHASDYSIRLRAYLVQERPLLLEVVMLRATEPVPVYRATHRMSDFKGANNEKVLQHYGVNVDFNGLIGVGVRDILVHGYFNREGSSASPSAPLPAVGSGRMVRWVIPRDLQPDNHIPGLLPDLSERMAQNRLLFESIATPLMQALVSGKVPVYYSNQPTRMPKNAVLRDVANHPSAPPENARRKPGKLDWSYGVAGIMVIGRWSKARIMGYDFTPQDLMVIWHDPSRDSSLQRTALGVVHLSDLRKLKLKVGDTSLEDYLSGISFLYAYPAQVNDFPLQNLEAAMYMRQLLNKGAGAQEMGNHVQLEAMTPLELRRKLQNAAPNR